VIPSRGAHLDQLRDAPEGAREAADVLEARLRPLSSTQVTARNYTTSGKTFTWGRLDQA
jgi:hypothetical protein